MPRVLTGIFVLEDFTMKEHTQVNKVRYIVVVGILSAISTVLMMLSFSVPFMPSFIKMDFSELPALLASFSLGPLAGVLVCLIKNLINVTMTTTGGVGELSNFILGTAFVLPAGLIYCKYKTRKSALLAALLGAVAMGSISILTNYFLIYPIYTKIMPIDVIIKAYQAILPSVDGLLGCLLTFNLPFTVLKGLANTLLTFLIYKRISPLIKGKH